MKAVCTGKDAVRVLNRELLSQGPRSFAVFQLGRLGLGQGHHGVDVP